MRHMYHRLARAAVIVLLPVLSVAAAIKPAIGDASGDALASLYNKMNVLFLDNKDLYNDRARRTIVWVYPGLPVAPAASNNAEGISPEESANLSRILNAAPSISAIYQERALNLPDAFRYVLDNSQVSDRDFSTAARKRLDEAYAVLEDTTKSDLMSDKYRKYLEYKAKYMNAVDTLNMAKLDEKQKNITCPTKLVDNVKKLESTWRTQGYKDIVELAMRTITAITQGEMVAWKKARDRLDSMTISDGTDDLPLTLTYPSYDQWDDRENWTVFTWEQKLDGTRPAGMQISAGTQFPQRSPMLSMNSTAMNRVSQLVRTNGVTSSLDCTSIAARALIEQQAMEFKNMKITARLKRIDIERPWLDENIFTSRYWKFNACSNQVLSAGPDALRRPQDEMVPLLIESVILSDSLDITAEVTAKEINAVAESKNLVKDAAPGASIGVGPFAIAGQQAWGKSGLSQNITVNGKVLRPGGLSRTFGSISSEYKGTNTLKISTNGLQIIGYICRYLPKAPNPDPKAVF